jgi:Domain of unknown function (DUF5666)
MNHHPAWSKAMSAQRSVPVPSDRPAHRRGSLARPGLALLTGALALTLAACGGGSSATTAAASPSSTHAARPSGANTPPGTFGTAAAVAASSLEVQNQQSGQVTVNFTSATAFTDTTSTTLAAVKVGSCVSVTAASGGMQAKTLAATAVSITPAGAKGCTEGGFGGGAGAGAGGFGGRPGGGAGGAGGASRTPNPSRQPRPSGANGPGGAGGFGRAFGSVTAVSATGFTVHGVARGSTPATDTAVTVTAKTTYTQSAKSTAKALAVGECIAAIGKADDTGAVAAMTIAISKAGPNGCSAGFGGGRGGFRGGAGGNGGQGGTGTGGGNG